MFHQLPYNEVENGDAAIVTPERLLLMEERDMFFIIGLLLFQYNLLLIPIQNPPV